MPLSKEQKAKLEAAKAQTAQQMHDQKTSQQKFNEIIEDAILNLDHLNDPLKKATVSTMGDSAKPKKGGCEII